MWNKITNNNDYYWRSNIIKIKQLDDTHFIEYTKGNHKTTFNIISKKKMKEYILEFDNKNMSGTSKILFNEISNIEYEIEFTEEIEPKNILAKYFGKYYLKRSQKDYINELESSLLEKRSNKEKRDTIFNICLFIFLYALGMILGYLSVGNQINISYVITFTIIYVAIMILIYFFMNRS